MTTCSWQKLYWHAEGLNQPLPLNCETLASLDIKMIFILQSRMTPMVVVEGLLISVPQEPECGNYAKLAGVESPSPMEMIFSVPSQYANTFLPRASFWLLLGNLDSMRLEYQSRS